MANSEEKLVIDYSKIGKKGYPLHYAAYNVAPPMKVALPEKEPQQPKEEPAAE